MPSEKPEPPNRKQFITSAFVFIGTAAGVGTFAFRALQYFFPQMKEERNVEIPICADSEIAEGQSKTFNIEDLNVIVIRNDGQLKAFSRICTHLNCFVQWEKEAKKFHCPCHHGYFDVSGKVVGGPPPKPLPAFELAIREKIVYLKYKSSRLFL